MKPSYANAFIFRQLHCLTLTHRSDSFQSALGGQKLVLSLWKYTLVVTNPSVFWHRVTLSPFLRRAFSTSRLTALWTSSTWFVHVPAPDSPRSDQIADFGRISSCASDTDLEWHCSSVRISNPECLQNHSQPCSVTLVARTLIVSNWCLTIGRNLRYSISNKANNRRRPKAGRKVFEPKPSMICWRQRKWAICLSPIDLTAGLSSFSSSLLVALTMSINDFQSKTYAVIFKVFARNYIQ
jgi:hypothetical protein